jgi:hypothetical protein
LNYYIKNINKKAIFNNVITTSPNHTLFNSETMAAQEQQTTTREPESCTRHGIEHEAVPADMLSRESWTAVNRQNAPLPLKQMAGLLR